MGKIEAHFYELSAPRALHLRSEIIDIDSILPNQIVAKTIYSAISPGTELAAYSGVEPLRNDRALYPRFIGYCNIAQVIEKGKDVTTYNIGDHFLNFQYHRSHFVFNEGEFGFIVKPEHLKEQCTAYLYHLGYHGLLTGGVRSGHNVGIIGLGTLGYSTLIMSDIAGANNYVFSNQSAHEKLVRTTNGHLFNKSTKHLSAVKQLTNNIGLDIIINTSNTWEDWKFAIQAINKSGTIVNIGFPGRGQVNPEFNPFDPKHLYLKNVKIKFLEPLNQTGLAVYEQRFNIERNLQYILELIVNQRVNCKDIISDEISYRALGKQYEAYKSRSQNLLSTILKW